MSAEILQQIHYGRYINEIFYTLKSTTANKYYRRYYTTYIINQILQKKYYGIYITADILQKIYNTRYTT